MRNFAPKSLIVTLAIILQLNACALLKAESTILEMLPNDCLFCAKVNNLDQSLTSIDQYMMGASPMPMGVSMMLKMQLGAMLANPTLNGINTQSDFAIAIISKGTPETMDDIADSVFIAGIIPVSDYDAYVAGIPGIKKSDKKNISILPANPAADLPEMAIKKVNDTVIITSVNAVNDLEKFSPAQKSDSLLKSLDANAAAQSQKQKFWIYASVEDINKNYGKLINSEINDLFDMFAEMPEFKTSMPFMKIYADIIKDALEQIDYKTVSADFTPEYCLLSSSLKAKTGTDFAKMLAKSDKQPSSKDVIGIFESKNFCNFAFNAKSPTITNLNKKYSEMLFSLSGEKAADKKSQELFAKFLNMSDGYGAGAMSLSNNSDSAFNYRIINKITNKDEYEKLIPAWLDFTKSFTADLNMTDEFSFEWANESEPLKYKGSKIYNGKFIVKSEDPEIQKQFDATFKDGLKYSSSVTDKYFTWVLANDSIEQTKKMIDHFKAGKVYDTEDPNIKKTLDIIPDARKADIFGTYNVVSMIKYGMLQNPMIQDKSMFESFETKSNIPFAGKLGNEVMQFDIAIPKEHMNEITQLSMAMAMMMQQTQQTQPNPMEINLDIPDSNE